MLGAGGVGGVLVLGKIKSWIFLSENTWGPSATQLETPDIKHTMQTNEDKAQRIEIILITDVPYLPDSPDRSDLARGASG